MLVRQPPFHPDLHVLATLCANPPLLPITARRRSNIERAKLRLMQLHGEMDDVTTGEKPRKQYAKAVAVLQVGARAAWARCMSTHAGMHARAL